MNLKLLFTALLVSTACWGQSTNYLYGDFNAALADSTIPTVVHLGAPSPESCGRPEHRGRMYTRLDPVSIYNALYICVETSPGILGWTVQGGAGAPGSMVYPAAGIANSNGSAWNTPFTTSGTGTVLCLTVNCALVTPNLGTPSALNLANATNIPLAQAAGNLTVSHLNGGTGASASTYWRGDGTWATVPAGGSMLYPLAGIPKSTGVGWTNSYSVSGTGTVVCLTVSCALVTPNLGIPSAVDLTNASNIPMAAAIGNLTVNHLGGGTGASAFTYWRGDGTWATPAAGGGSPASANADLTAGVVTWPNVSTGCSGGPCTQVILTRTATISNGGTIPGGVKGQKISILDVQDNAGGHGAAAPSNVLSYPVAGLDSGCFLSFDLQNDGTNWESTGASTNCTPTVISLKTTGSATGKNVVCVDTATGILYASSTGTGCDN